MLASVGGGEAKPLDASAERSCWPGRPFFQAPPPPRVPTVFFPKAHVSRLLPSVLRPFPGTESAKVVSVGTARGEGSPRLRQR